MRNSPERPKRNSRSILILFVRLALALLFSLALYLLPPVFEVSIGKTATYIINELRPEAIGILFTVLILDWLIAQTEEKTWEGVRGQAALRVKDVYRKTGTAIRWSGTSADELYRELYRVNPELAKKGEGHYEVAQFFLDRYASMSHEKRWELANPYYWMNLSNTLASVVDSAEKTIDLYGSHLKPEISAALDKLASFCQRTRSDLVFISAKIPDKIDLNLVDMHFKIIFGYHKELGELMEKNNL